MSIHARLPDGAEIRLSLEGVPSVGDHVTVYCRELLNDKRTYRVAKVTWDVDLGVLLCLYDPMQEWNQLKDLHDAVAALLAALQEQEEQSDPKSSWVDKIRQRAYEKEPVAIAMENLFDIWQTTAVIKPQP